MKGNGSMTNKMDKVKKSGLMVLSTMVVTCKEKSMAKGNSFGQMDQFMKENSKITIFKGPGYICGQMDENMSEIGNLIRWMVKE